MPDSHLIIVGDGPEMNRLKQHAEGLGLIEGVTFLKLAPRIGKELLQTQRYSVLVTINREYLYL